MTRCGARTLVLVCLSSSLPSQTRYVRTAQVEAKVEIHAAKIAPYRIPRTIFGTFLEPIIKATYGGLWAQLLENPSFEENLWSAEGIRELLARNPALAAASNMGLPLPWEPLEPKQGWRYEPRWGDAANSSRSLLIMALPHGETGVRQEVYLPVHRVLRYTGSLYVRALDGPAEIDVSIRRRNQPEQVLARSGFGADSQRWAKYEFS